MQGLMHFGRWEMSGKHTDWDADQWDDEAEGDFKQQSVMST
jgi:hypothetical protein